MNWFRKKPRKIKIKKLKDTDRRLYDNCPRCGWDAPDFDGISYYRVDPNEIEIIWDFVGAIPPENYYPRISEESSVTIPYAGAIKQWKEIHMCPLCNKEFEFLNTNA